jgi:hypothetical protein
LTLRSGGNVDEQRVPVAGVEYLDHHIPASGTGLGDERTHFVGFGDVPKSFRHCRAWAAALGFFRPAKSENYSGFVNGFHGRPPHAVNSIGMPADMG